MRSPPPSSKVGNFWSLQCFMLSTTRYTIDVFFANYYLGNFWSFLFQLLLGVRKNSLCLKFWIIHELVLAYTIDEAQVPLYNYAYLRRRTERETEAPAIKPLAPDSTQPLQQSFRLLQPAVSSVIGWQSSQICVASLVGDTWPFSTTAIVCHQGIWCQLQSYRYWHSICR